MNSALCETDRTVGFSDAAHLATNMCNKFLKEREADHVYRDVSARRIEMVRFVRDLNEVYLESSRDNWDNCGAKRADPLSLNYARDFVLLLMEKKLGLSPEIFVDPDGSMSFDWENIKTKASISISFGNDGWLYYLGLYKNGSKIKGKEIFDGSVLPSHICSLISRVVDEQ